MVEVIMTEINNGHYFIKHICIEHGRRVKIKRQNKSMTGSWLKMFMSLKSDEGNRFSLAFFEQSAVMWSHSLK